MVGKAIFNGYASGACIAGSAILSVKAVAIVLTHWLPFAILTIIAGTCATIIFYKEASK